MPSIRQWTVVQHSAFGYAGDTQFEQGLESREITTEGERRQVESVGGLIFDSYMEAEDFAEKAMYPEDATGLIPAARGTFADKKIDGLAIYIPVRVVVG